MGGSLSMRVLLTACIDRGDDIDSPFGRHKGWVSGFQEGLPPFTSEEIKPL
jgi:hypothetical protein